MNLTDEQMGYFVVLSLALGYFIRMLVVLVR